MRIGKESHDRLLNKTAQIPLVGHEQDHFLGIDVFHQLHCLVRAADTLVKSFFLYTAERDPKGILSAPL